SDSTRIGRLLFFGADLGVMGSSLGRGRRGVLPTACPRPLFLPLVGALRSLARDRPSLRGASARPGLRPPAAARGAPGPAPPGPGPRGRRRGRGRRPPPRRGS